MTELIILIAMAVFASFVALRFLPHLAQRTAVYGIHGSREEIYALGASESIRATRLYADAELVTNLALHIARAGTTWDTINFVWALMKPRSPMPPSQATIKTVQEFVRVVGPKAAPHAFQRLQIAMTQIEMALCWRVLWSSPLTWPFALLLTAIFAGMFVVIMVGAYQRSREMRASRERESLAPVPMPAFRVTVEFVQQRPQDPEFIAARLHRSREHSTRTSWEGRGLSAVAA